MKRRGLFGPFNPLRRPARQVIDDQLVQANSLFENGRFIDAGVLFERIAQMAASHNGPRAPRFYIQAGRSFLHAGKIERAMALFESGHAILERNGQAGVITQVSLRVQAEIEQLGYLDQAKQIAAWVREQPAGNAQLIESNSKRPTLPLRCPSCGGAIHPNEVTWLDDVTAECDYCGSAVRGE